MVGLHELDGLGLRVESLPCMLHTDRMPQEPSALRFRFRVWLDPF